MPVSSRDGNIRHMLSELESLGHGLTAREQRFLESVMDDWDRLGALTDEQYRKLTEIYNERVK